jgi:hypothetical protein
LTQLQTLAGGIDLSKHIFKEDEAKKICNTTVSLNRQKDQFILIGTSLEEFSVEI